ncbi:MAG: IS701-like element ISMae34 family transposase, partial [Microcystis sp. LE18-22.4A]|uniref:IS701-like element ISMae34 family transposase n=1 Tax=Microcystis sp. LE18-22.4A TaxID=3016432 RepID=UPI0022BF9695
MKETTPAAMPPCFDRWCRRFDNCFKNEAQKNGFRQYLGGLLGESERKNLTQMANNAVGVVYNRLHHFLTESPWSDRQVNECRLQVMNQCRQPQIPRGFSLIVEYSGHRKCGNLTAGVGRQYLGDIGKTDNGIVAVTTHLYDGKKSVPLDMEIYQPASSLAEGKEDKEFKKKPEIAIDLIDRSLTRGYRPKIVLIDAGYGNNTNFLKALEERKLKYLGGLAKNRKVIIEKEGGVEETIQLEQLAKSLSEKDWEKITLNLDKEKTVWVAVFRAKISQLEGERNLAIVMNASSMEKATEVDYFITNVVEADTVTASWIVKTYTERNWVEVFYREAKGWLGLREYQVRDKRSLLRHFILVFCAYTFILWHKLTGGLQRQWANRPLNTFVEALAAFRTAMSFRFFEWLTEN